MFFSVIIPAYNEENFIENTICSIAKAWEYFKKNRQNTDGVDQMEIIIVNNGSTDNTAKVAEIAIQKCKLTLWKILDFNKEKGPSFARDEGFRNSRGDIICFIDADCQMSLRWFMVIKEILENKKIVAVGGPYKYNFVKWWQKFLNNIYSYFVLPFLPFVLYILFWKKSAVLIGGNVAVKREALLKIGGVPKIKFWGDDAFLAMLLARKVGKVKFSPKLVVFSSARRYEKDGFWKVNKKYTLEFFRIFFKNL